MTVALALHQEWALGRGRALGWGITQARYAMVGREQVRVRVERTGAVVVRALGRNPCAVVCDGAKCRLPRGHDAVELLAGDELHLLHTAPLPGEAGEAGEVGVYRVEQREAGEEPSWPPAAATTAAPASPRGLTKEAIVAAGFRLTDQAVVSPTTDLAPDVDGGRGGGAGLNASAPATPAGTTVRQLLSRAGLAEYEDAMQIFGEDPATLRAMGVERLLSELPMEKVGHKRKFIDFLGLRQQSEGYRF